MYCSNCGASLSVDLKFCSSCGTAVQANADIELSPDSKTWMTTFIGPKNTAYYLRHFDTFSKNKNSGITWNWPAFFITFYWLLYRKMWVNSIIYFILPYLLLIPLVIVVAMIGDSANSTLVLGIGYVVYLAAYFFLPPMYANILYYRHYKAKLTETKLASRDIQRQLGILSEKGGTSSIAIIFILIFSFIFLFGILAAIAIPAYQDYTIRAKIAEGMNSAAAAKLAVAETFAETNTVPADNIEAGFVFKNDSPNVQDIRIEDGTITIVMAAAPNVNGVIVLEPVKGVDDSISWECYSPDIKAKYLPPACR